jgi:hypothetical protein
MKYPTLALVVSLLLAGHPGQAQQTTATFNKALSDSLNEMKTVDQIAANVRSGKYKELPEEAWQQYKDSVFGTHKVILENMFNRYGFPGFDVAGKDGSFNFWLMVQHCDKYVPFQEKVLASMKKQVDKGNANPQNYAYLTDRVRLNTGRKQLYGTQVTYNLKICQAYPRPTEDSLNINKRRKEMGMESIEAYLNGVSEGHFEMNRASYEQRGITKPQLYAIKSEQAQ